MPTTNANALAMASAIERGSNYDLGVLLREMIDSGGVGMPSRTATAASGAATLNSLSGKITTEDLTTAGQASYTLTLTNSLITAADILCVSVANGTNNAGRPIVGTVTPGAGSVAIVINNEHASTALNGNLVISFMIQKVG